MTFIETWRGQIPLSLTEIARQVAPDQRLDIGLLAVSMFWPIRTDIQRGDAAATDALHQIVGDDAVPMRELVCSWPDDLRAAANAASASAASNASMHAALLKVATFLDVVKPLAAQIVEQVQPEARATVSLGAITAALVNIGGTINIATLIVQLPVNTALQAAERLHAAFTLLTMLPLDAVPNVALQSAHSRMPLSPNPLFVGREADLKQLAATLKAGQTTVIAAATGIGGIGKTQLASEFAHRYGQYFAGGVFWLSFAEAGSVDAEIVACGRAMGLPGFDALEVADQVARVRQAWQEPTPRLLVFDNCEKEVLLRDYRPINSGCRVLVTSRWAHWDAVLGVHEQRLDTLPRAESIALLCQFRPDLVADDSDLDDLANELGDLPLALHLAGSFLKLFADISPNEYLGELRAAALLEHESLRGVDLNVSPTNALLNVGRTFALSYDRLNANNDTDTLALALLARTACFAPGVPVPNDLLRATVELPDGAERQAKRALRRLVNLGLVDEEQGDALRLHRLIAAFVQGVAGDNGAQAAVEGTMDRVASDLNAKAIPAPLLALQTHLRHITDVAHMRVDERAARLCNELGYHLNSIADYAGARPYYERALLIREQALGPSHPTTASSLNNLGALLNSQGDYSGARPYYERALLIREQALGPSHPDTASSLNNLGALLHSQGE